MCIVSVQLNEFFKVSTPHNQLPDQQEEHSGTWEASLVPSSRCHSPEGATLLTPNGTDGSCLFRCLILIESHTHFGVCLLSLHVISRRVVQAVL